MPKKEPFSPSGTAAPCPRRDADVIFFPGGNRQAMPTREEFLRNWLQNAGVCRAGAFAEWAGALEIDLALPRVVALLRAGPPAAPVDTDALLDDLQRQAAVYLPGSRLLSVRMEGDALALLLHTRDAAYVAGRLAACKAVVEGRHGGVLWCGVGPVCNTPDQVADGYRAARHACEASAGSRDNRPAVCGEVSLEMLAAEIPLESRRRFFQQVFHNCPPAQLDEWVEDLRTYFASDGSIGAAAGAAHVHKNTMQYRLNRIAQATGFNPRRAAEAPALYLAVLFAQDSRILQ